MNIAIKNINGMDENIVVVRYFQFNGANYLIFTRNEVDEAGYQKLYTTKVVNNVGSGINDEIEWNLLRDTIKVIAKANKENTTLPVQDLNDMSVNGIQIIGEKPFKLTSASVALLSANKSTNNVANNVASIPQNSVPVEQSSVSVATTPVQTFDNTTGQLPTTNNNVLANDGVIENIPVGAVASPLNDTTVQSTINQSSNQVGLPVMPELQNSSFNVANEVTANNNVVTPVQNVTPQVDVMNISSVPFDNNQVIANDNGILQQNLYSDLQPSSTVASSNVVNGGSSVDVVPQPTIEPSIDYKKLYDEQTLKLNALTLELDKYKNIVEQLKNILK